jgi:trk system potassium uptake protein TrkH
MPSINETYMGLLFWRSFAQWLGGMGIILLFVAILPRLGVAGRQLYRAEVPGPDKDALTPRIRQTARVLWGVYILLTVAEIVLLYLAGMNFYDSLCNTFATMATGGFSPQGSSITAYKSWLIDGIITLFMFLAGANFALHYRVLHSDRKALFRDPEFKFYTLIILASTAMIMIWGGLEGDIFDRFRYSVFQVVSIMTTTGFVTTDYDRWTAAAKYILLLLMIIGACAGSTGGAIKVVRILLVLKSGFRELLHALHPKAVMTIKLGGNPVRDDILRPSNVFVAMYLFIFAAASLLLAIISYGDPMMNIEAVLSAVATTLGNVGPGLGKVGPMFSFADIQPAGKMLLFFCMWIGRLEIVPVLVLFVPEFWKK